MHTPANKNINPLGHTDTRACAHDHEHNVIRSKSHKPLDKNTHIKLLNFKNLTAIGRITSRDLEPNLEYGLGLMNINGNIIYSNQLTMNRNIIHSNQLTMNGNIIRSSKYMSPADDHMPALLFRMRKLGTLIRTQKTE